MERYGQRLRQFHQSLGALDVDSSVFMQYPQHNAVYAELLRSPDIVAHGFKLMIGITKIAGARANQNMDRNAYVASNGLHQAGAGSDSGVGVPVAGDVEDIEEVRPEAHHMFAPDVKVFEEGGIHLAITGRALGTVMRAAKHKRTFGAVGADSIIHSCCETGLS